MQSDSAMRPYMYMFKYESPHVNLIHIPAHGLLEETRIIVLARQNIEPNFYYYLVNVSNIPIPFA